MAKKRQDKAQSYSKGLRPTKERQCQNGGIVAESIHEKSDGKIYTLRHRALFECSLDAYLWHAVINQAQYEVGLKFGREYKRSVYKIQVYDTGAGSHGDLEMATLSSINGNIVLRNAFKLLSLKQRAVLINVCADNNRAGGQRQIKMLCDGLKILAKHWNML